MSAARGALRTVAIALFFAFVVGLGVGTWLRCQMEKPQTFIGAAPSAARAG